MADSKQYDVVVIIVPLPTPGYLQQSLELAHRLSTTYNLPVHFIGTTQHVKQAQSRARGWDPLTTPNLNFSEFPVPFEVPPPRPDASIKFPSQLVPAFNSTLHLRHPVAELVKNLSATSRKVVVIHDFLTSYVVQDVPKIPNTECYCFHTSAFVGFSYLYDAAKPPVPPEAEVVLEQLPSLDGCYAPELDVFIHKQLQARARVYGVGNVYSASVAIEGLYLDLMKLSYPKGFKLWAIGPFNPVEILNDTKKCHYSLEWLDNQPEKSVIFVSFGSTNLLSEEEIDELGKGLEQSGERFIWVLRDADKGDIFDGDVRRYELPEGYEERVRDRGLVVRDWAPQLEILGHPSTGGFMSHCGWNSCMESISMGVPIAAWPMHSDQPRNALFITEGLKIGISVRDWEKRKEVVPAEKIEKTVKTLMGSEEIKQKAAELREAVKAAVKEGGATHQEMESFVAHITR